MEGTGHGLSGCPQTHADASAPPEVHALRSEAARLEDTCRRLHDVVHHAPADMRLLRVCATAVGEAGGYLVMAAQVLRFAADCMAAEKGGRN